MRKGLTISKSIQLIEKVIGIKLSPKQKEVLEYNYRTPVLLNSCAGAGKTTLVIISMILQVLTGKNNPKNIMGVTFSRDARLNMQLKYRHFIADFENIGFNFQGVGIPYFTTFHALFFHLLCKINNKIEVIPSYTKCLEPLYKAFVTRPNVRTKADVLRDYFQLRSVMINYGYTEDGYRRHGKVIPLQTLSLITDKMDTTNSSPRALRNYIPIMRAYNFYKKRNHLIDFNDMKVKLYQYMQKPVYAQIVHHYTNHFHMCLLDEFQDIDPLQWKLMKLILPKSAKTHLGAVGDDDQSIYSFRGSDPNIILNFQKNVPHAKRFDLTTNYRTAGKILKGVRPEISLNKYRLGKKLETFRPNVGTIIRYDNNKYHSSARLMYRKLYELMQNPKIPNSQIAVLSRKNIDKTFVIDQLANHGYYINTSNRCILQNNYLYKVFVDLMIAFYNNVFVGFYKYSSKIHFSAYTRHVTNILYTFHTRISSISQYVALAQYFDKMNHSRITRRHGGYYRIKTDRKIARTLDKVQHLKVSKTKDKTHALFEDIKELTSSYFNYMYQHKYLNRTFFDNIINYLSMVTSQENDPIKFFNAEHKKDDILSLHNPNLRKNAQVMTIHQSKGLQFDYVLLFNVAEPGVDDTNEILDKYFAPNETLQQFLDNVLKYKDDIDTINTEIEYICNHLPSMVAHTFVKKAKGVKDKNKLHIGKTQHRIYQQVMSKNTHYPKLRDKINSAYQDMVKETTEIERFRRLVYVGATRAKYGLYFNMVINDDNPVLNEIKVPLHNCLSMDKHGKIVHKDDKFKQLGLSNEETYKVNEMLKQFK